MSYVNIKEYISIERYGIAVHDGPHPLAKVIGDDLFIGGKKVKDYNAANFNGTIPVFYTIRYFDGEWAELITTFDLKSNGKCWTPDIDFDTAEECFEYIMKNKNKNDLNYPDFDIYLEDPMLLPD